LLFWLAFFIFTLPLHSKAINTWQQAYYRLPKLFFMTRFIKPSVGDKPLKLLFPSKVLVIMLADENNGYA
jgi:hypothetical protein